MVIVVTMSVFIADYINARIDCKGIEDNHVKTEAEDEYLEDIQRELEEGPEDLGVEDIREKEVIIINSIEELLEYNKRINILILGLDGTRSDTMMIASIDRVRNYLDIISIPRDTYYPRKRYNGVGMKKINFIYPSSGHKAVYDAIEDIMSGLKMDYFIVLKYIGVERIVDSIGGVPITINKTMKYDDKHANPPLHIYFKPGDYTLNGEDSVKYLRYRQANHGSGALQRNGDLGRIESQQDFIESAIKQIDRSNIINLVRTIISEIDTDINLSDAIKLGIIAAGIPNDNINFWILPGNMTSNLGDGLCYYKPDFRKIKEMIIEIYSQGFD